MRLTSLLSYLSSYVHDEPLEYLLSDFDIDLNGAKPSFDDSLTLFKTVIAPPPLIVLTVEILSRWDLHLLLMVIHSLEILLNSK